VAEMVMVLAVAGEARAAPNRDGACTGGRGAGPARHSHRGGGVCAHRGPQARPPV
jgi:hypothetical protein